MIGSVLTGRGDGKGSGAAEGTMGSFACGGAMGSINGGEDATD